MTRLRTSELEALLAFVGDAYAVDAAEPFTPELLDRLATLVPSDRVALEEVDFARRALVLKVWSSNGRPSECSADDAGGELAPAHWETMDASPTAAHRRDTRDFRMLKWSDFLGRRQRARHAADYGESSVIDQASVWLEPSLVHKISIVFTASERDFSERDRLVGNVLRPHLAGLHRFGRVRRSLAAALAGLERGSDPDGYGVVLRRRDGTVEFVSSRARRLLDDYFPGSGTRLPTELEDWIDNAARRTPPLPLAVAGPGRRLVVDALGPDRATLLVAEEPAPSVPLTSREWDVMRCVAAGNSNAEIARLLWIAPGTVRKHLENIYAKLGVHGRTAAVARLRPSLADRGSIDVPTGAVDAA